MNCNLPEDRDIHWATILGKLVEMKFVVFCFVLFFSGPSQREV